MKTKVLIILMTCVLLLCACGKVKTNNSKTPDIVSESASYYEGHNLVLADEYKNEKEYSHATIRPWLYDDNYIVVAIFADKLSSDSNTLPEQYINLYDYDGNLINQTDLYSLEDIKTVTELCIGKAKDGMNVIIADQKSNCLILYNVGYESMTWQKEFALPLNDFNIGFLPKHLFEVDDGYVIAYDWLDGSNYRSNIAKIDLSGKVIWDTKSSTKNNLYKADIWNDSLLYSDDFNQFYKVDLKTGKDQQIQKNDTLKTYTNNVFILPEGRIIDAFGQEIRQYNLNDHTEIVLADLNYTDCNMSSICRGLVHADDKRIVTRDFFSYGNEAWGRCKLTVLEKADRNPHAGKKVLEIAPVWGINEIIGETQQVFNKNNKNYYAYISTRYDSTYFSLPEYQQQGETLADTVNLITDQLAVDIRNGNGPDIIIGLGDSTQLDSQDFLVNLYPYIDGKNGINKADYFENAFEAFAANGELYQIPLSINVRGIVTDRSNVADGKKGFTFDEYNDFVKEVCNGIDPLSIGNDRQNYFYYLFCSMKEQFINNGKMNVDNESFRSLIEYSKNNISEERYPKGTEPNGARWIVLTDIYCDLVERPYLNSSSDIYGAPSTDGRGPMLECFNTVAISTCSSDLNVSWEFVKTSISYDVQKSFIEGNPINRAAFNEYAKTALKEAIITLKERQESRVLDESDIERYVHMLEKAECVASFDTQVYTVMIEELQPYYADKKSIDETIKIISDRCQKVLDER
jgi:hypothetical protein